MPEKRESRGELSMLKCEACRRSKKKCLPLDRKWPEKCERCAHLDLPCSPSSRKKRQSLANSSNGLFTLLQKVPSPLASHRRLPTPSRASYDGLHETFSSLKALAWIRWKCTEKAMDDRSLQLVEKAFLRYIQKAKSCVCEALSRSSGDGERIPLMVMQSDLLSLQFTPPTTEPKGLPDIILAASRPDFWTSEPGDMNPGWRRRLVRSLDEQDFVFELEVTHSTTPFQRGFFCLEWVLCLEMLALAPTEHPHYPGFYQFRRDVDWNQILSFGRDIPGIKPCPALGWSSQWAPCDLQGRTPLHIAAFLGADHIMYDMLSKGWNPLIETLQRQNILHLAAMGGCRSSLLFLGRNVGEFYHYDLDQYGRSTIWYAAASGDLETVKMAVARSISAYADPHSQETPLLPAANPTHQWRGLTPIAQLIIKTGCWSRSHRGNGKLIEQAIRHKDLQFLQALNWTNRWGAGFDFELRLPSGNTPLTLATKLGHKELVGWLAGHPRIDPNGRDDSGFSALEIATLEGQEEMVLVLAASPRVERTEISLLVAAPNSGFSLSHIDSLSGFHDTETQKSNAAMSCSAEFKDVTKPLPINIGKISLADLAKLRGYEGIEEALRKPSSSTVSSVTSESHSMPNISGYGPTGALETLVPIHENQILVETLVSTCVVSADGPNSGHLLPGNALV